jgi:hypothetical protein
MPPAPWKPRKPGWSASDEPVWKSLPIVLAARSVVLSCSPPAPVNRAVV